MAETLWKEYAWVVCLEPDAGARAAALNAAGLKARAVPTPGEAVALAGERPGPSAFVYDLSATDDGDETETVLNSVRAAAGAADLPAVLLLPPGRRIPLPRAAMETGVILLVPPFDDERFVKAVRTQLEVSRLHTVFQGMGLKDDTRLVRLMAMKDRFFEMSAYDAQPPLVAMRLALEMLEMQFGVDAGPGLRRLLDLLVHSLSRVEEKFEDLRQIANLGRPDEESVFAPVSVTDEARTVLERLHSDALARGITLSGDWGDAPPVSGVAARLRRMLADLVTFSMSRVDVGMAVRVRVAAEDGGVRIVVDDDAPCMSAKRLEAIMRGLAHDQPDEETRVTLYMAHRVAAAHGGRLDLRAKPDGGMNISVWLPGSAQ